MRRALLVLVGVPLGLEGAYLLAANAYLRSSAFERLLAKPGRATQVTLTSGFTPFPGRWHARGLVVTGTSPRLDWRVAADEASGWVSLPALLGRRLVLRSAVGAGIEVQVRRREAPPRATELEAAVPALPLREPVAPRPAGARPFELRLEEVELRQVRELWLDVFRIRGPLVARGGFTFRTGASAEVLPSSLELSGASVEVGSRRIVSDLRGTVETRVAPYPYREERGWEISRHVTGHLRLEGVLADLGLLDPWLQGVEWLRVGGGEGPFRLDLGVARGEALPGSRLELPARALEVHVLDYHAAGTGAIDWQVREGELGSRLEARLPAFAVRRQGEDQPYLEGRDLALVLRSRDRQLDGRLGLAGVEVDFPSGRVADLRSYNRYLPARLGLAILGGEAELAARFSSADGQRGEGELTLRSPRAAIALERLRVTGKLEVWTRLASTDLAARRFDLAGTRLDLSQVAVEGGRQPCAGWWGRFELEEGTASPRAERFLEARLRVALRDSGPLVEALGVRRAVPDLVHELLTVGEVHGSAWLALARRRLELDRFEVRAARHGVEEAVGLDARLRLEPGSRHGALLAQLGRWAVGVELAGAERDWVLLGARDWFRALTGREARPTRRSSNGAS